MVTGCAVLGLAVGSFLNVVISRVPRRQSVVRPPSRCPGCETELLRRDNVPVVSWLVLGGRCRHCRQPISARYPLVELVTAGVFAATAVRFGARWELSAFLVLFAGLVAVSMIDLELGVVPTRIVYPVLVATAVLLVGGAALEGRWTELGHALVGGLAAWLFFGLLWWVYPRGIGFGDVRLAPLLGAHLGFLSLMHVFVGIFLAALLGAATGLALQATTRRSARDPIPFAPFLALATLITVLFGAAFLGWYDQSVLRRPA